MSSPRVTSAFAFAVVLAAFLLASRAEWLAFIRLPFAPNDVKLLQFFSANHQFSNPKFIEQWNISYDNSGTHVRVVTGDRPSRNDVELCLTRKTCILLWPNFVSDGLRQSFSNIGPKNFTNETYSFSDYSRDYSTNSPGVVVRDFLQLGLHDAMDRMQRGEKLYLGFDRKLVDHNTVLKEVASFIAHKLNAFGPLFNYVGDSYMSQSFLYYGNKHPSGIHNEPLSAFSLQLANSKLWRFVHPDNTAKMRSIKGDNPGVFYSEHVFIDTEHGIPFFDVLVEPGSLMFFPAHWWHQVHAIDKEKFGFTIAMRNVNLGELVSFKSMFYTKSILLHKLTAFIDMAWSRRDPKCPEAG